MAKTFAELNEQLKALVGEIEEAIKKELKELREFEEDNIGRIRFECDLITRGINVDDIWVDELYIGKPSWVNYTSNERMHSFDLEDEYAKTNIKNYKLEFKEQDEEEFEEYQRKKDTQYQEYLRLKALYE